jgi:glycosyltransferase involved in cell wall biosynthesis
MSKSSRLFQSFPHHHIPNGLSSSKYISTERQAARLHLNLPLNKRILLFISDAVGTKRKGFSYLLDALKILTLGGDNLLLCSVGSDVNKNLFGELPVQQWGYVQDSEKLSMLYSAADAFIIPSVIDNFPNTVIESLMCGTPVIGFPTGGIVDAIEQGKNGLVCKEVSVKALAKGIKSFFQTQHLFWGQDKIRQEAMNKYDSTVQAKSYIEVYEKLLN